MSSLPTKPARHRGHRLRRQARLAGWTAPRWITVVAFALLTLASLAAVAALLRPWAWTYYTDGLGIRQPAAETLARLVVWEPPQPVTASRMPANAAGAGTDQIEPSLSADGQLMVYVRGRAKQNADLMLSRWDGRAWSEPTPIVAINTASDELGPELGADGRSLYFYSDRPGGLGGYDLWVSLWDNEQWTTPVNVGLEINSPFNEYDPALSPGGDQLYFSSNRPKRALTDQEQRAWQASLREALVTADYDIFVAASRAAGQSALPAWGAPRRLDALNSGAYEGQVTLTARGDFIYFSSNRDGGLGGFDLYRSRLWNGEFQPPENIGAPVNTTRDEMDPALWMAGYQLVFSSNRDPAGSGQFALYQSISREVMVARDLGQLAAMWQLVKKLKWMLLMGLLSLIPLLWLLRTFLDRQRRRAYGLLHRCLLASVMAHLLVAFLFSLWVISEAMIKAAQESSEFAAVDTGALAQERLALEIREEVTALATPTAPAALAQPVDRLEFPEIEPLKQIVHQPQVAQVKPEAFDMPVETPREQASTAAPPPLPRMAVPKQVTAMPMPSLTVTLETPEPATAQVASTFQPARDPVQLPTRELAMDTIAPQQPELKIATASAVAAASPTVLTNEPAPPMMRALPGHVARLSTPTNMPPLAFLAASIAMEQPATPPVQQGQDDPRVARDTTVTAASPSLPATSGDPVKSAARMPVALPAQSQQQPAAALDAIRSVTPRQPSSTVQPVAFVKTAKMPPLEIASAVTLEAPGTLKQNYLLRDQKLRSQFLKQLGGSDETEAAIKGALDWFTRHQEPDGRWEIAKHGGERGHDVAATGLALLCYMGWGATHKQPGPHQPVVAKAVDWLVSQAAADGSVRGVDGNMYDHGIAVIALAEAYGLTSDPKLKTVVEKAVQFTVKAQHPHSGGWRYQPGDEGDTSVFGWQVMALKSAELSGLTVPVEAFDRARVWLKRVGGGQQGGLYGYQNKSPKPAMAAEGMFCQQLMGVPAIDPVMRETAQYLNTSLPQANHVDYYFWYYGTLALYQHQGPIWEEWNNRMRPILVNGQVTQGEHAGSWNPGGQWAGQSGRAVTTALATLSLEVYYRYLPLYGAQMARGN